MRVEFELTTKEHPGRRRWSAVLSTILSTFLLNILLGGAALAERCDRLGVPLHELLAGHDAVAVVEKVGAFRQLPRAMLGRGVVFDAKLLEIIKPPVFGNLKIGDVVALYPENINLLESRGRRRMLVFMNFAGSGIWVTEQCRYLEITPGGLVRDVCNAVSDLFGENPYEREQRCLLNYPPAAPLPDVRAEIKQTMQDGRHYRGSARVMKSLVWKPDAEFQTVLIQPEPRTKTEFFGTKLARRNSTVRAYLRSGVFTGGELERIGREGKRITFEGFWERGSFIIASVEGR